MILKIKLLISAIRRHRRQRKCEHEWLIPNFSLEQREYRVMCTKCGKELWWGDSREE